MEGWGLPEEEHEDQQVTLGQAMLVEQGLSGLVEIQSHFLFAGAQCPAVTQGHSAVTLTVESSHPELSQPVPREPRCACCLPSLGASGRQPAPHGDGRGVNSIIATTEVCEQGLEMPLVLLSRSGSP